MQPPTVSLWRCTPRHRLHGLMASHLAK